MQKKPVHPTFDIPYNHILELWRAALSEPRCAAPHVSHFSYSDMLSLSTFVNKPYQRIESV